MNTAECVIEGHGIDVKATGRSVYIRTIQWCSLLFTLAVFGILVSFAEYCRREGSSDIKGLYNSEIYIIDEENANTTGLDRQKIRIKNTAKAIYYIIVLLSTFGICQRFVLIIILILFYMEEGFFYMDILPILASLWLIPIIYASITLILLPHGFLRKRFPNLPINILPPVFICSGKLLSVAIAFTFSASASLSFCWMLIGMMLSPTWGLAVTLIICFILASFTYAVYEHLTLDSCIYYDGIPDKLCALSPGKLNFLTCLILIPAVIFASPWFNGRENADETLKTILMTVLATFIWLTSKKLLGKEKKSEEKVIDSRQTLTNVLIREARQPSSRKPYTHSASSQNSHYSCHSESHPLVNDHNTAESQPSNDDSFISLSQKSQACGKMVQNSENIEFNETQRIYRESNV